MKKDKFEVYELSTILWEFYRENSDIDKFNNDHIDNSNKIWKELQEQYGEYNESNKTSLHKYNENESYECSIAWHYANPDKCCTMDYKGFYYAQSSFIMGCLDMETYGRILLEHLKVHNLSY